MPNVLRKQTPFADLDTAAAEEYWVIGDTRRVVVPWRRVVRDLERNL